jgi:enterochelin esterase-like enzyme
VVASAYAGTAPVGDEVVFSLADPEGRLRRVRLVHELSRPRTGPELRRAARGRPWELRLPRPSVDRIEYRLELTHAGGDVEVVCDPHNPLRAAGPFGETSVLELPGYRPPAWLGANAPAGRLQTVRVESRTLGASFAVGLWTPKGIRGGRRLPLLFVHDGPEYADHSALLRFTAAAVAAGDLPPFRVALLPPRERNRDYSASARYGRALVRELVPALERAAPTPSGPEARAALGASLGALAFLHAHRAHPGSFGGLFLQSGSFFRQRFDRYERDFAHFGRISRFVGSVLAAPAWPDPVPVVLTCGTVEENLANNRAVAAALDAQGYDVRLAVVRDAHNWVAWRDALDAGLTGLLRRLWG